MAQCAFCGSAPVKRALVLPEWDRTKAAIACKACNQGWIASLDEAAGPVVSTLAAGQPFVLDLLNQRTLALWAAKTILMLEAARGAPPFTRAVYRDLHERRRPPVGFRLAVGIRPREGAWPVRFAAQGYRASHGRPGLLPTFPGMAIDSYRAGLCVGHLVVRARAAFAPADARPLAERRSARAIEIWPARAPARWPPQDGLVRIRSFDAAFEREADLARLAA